MMVVEKTAYWGIDDEKSQLLSYEQIRSNIDADYTVEKVRQSDKAWYEEAKDRDWFKEDFPDCDTYEKYEQAFLKKYGYSSYSDYVKIWKQYDEMEYKAKFGAQVTYAYKNEDGKMTLTEKFTGVKNFLLYETCRYDKDGTIVEIEFSKGVSIIREVNGKREYWDGEFGAGNSIEFEEDDSGVKKTGSYTENLEKETVTIKFDNNDYECKFREINFIQE